MFFTYLAKLLAVLIFLAGALSIAMGIKFTDDPRMSDLVIYIGAVFIGFSILVSVLSDIASGLKNINNTLNEIKDNIGVRVEPRIEIEDSIEGK